MLKNYFLIAVRSFKKDRINALISLSGLVVGLACVMLIVGYIRYETSFETSYSNSDRIYRLISIDKESWGAEKHSDVPTALAPTLAREMPEVLAATNVDDGRMYVLSKNEYISLDSKQVSSSFFSVFNFKLLSGNLKDILNDKHKVVLTKSAALRLFKNLNVIGKPLVAKGGNYVINGIVEDLPKNSFLSSDAFTYTDEDNESLANVSQGYTTTDGFILLNKNSSPQTLKNKLSQLLRKYKMKNFQFELQPVSRIHLYSSDLKGSSGFNIGDIKYVYVYGAIGLLILLIGCINFINLSIARSIERAKEIGVRKVLGAHKKQLIFQFISESALYYAIAVPVALILACIFWSNFITLLNIDAGISFLLNMQTVLIIIAICIVATLLSSLYPAFFLSRLQPANTLKGSRLNGLKLNLGLRKALIVFQFTVSIVLIAATIIIHKQLSYLNNAPLGFNKNNLLIIKLPVGVVGDAFKHKILQNSNVQYFSYSTFHIADHYGGTSSENDPKDSAKEFKFAYLDADFNFMKTLQIPIIQGRDFSANYPSDLVDYDSIFFSELKKNRELHNNDPAGIQRANALLAKQPVIVSEELVKALDLKDPVGQTINMASFRGTIIGVIKYFKGLSLKEENPFVVIKEYSKLNFGEAYLRINATNTASTINYISKTFRQFFPQDKFDFSFVDDRIAHLYDSEMRLTKLFNIFAFLAIVISCMGLFSLVSLMVRKRTKEIGIRKVLGASVKDIVMLISKDFIWLIAISFIVATPLAYIAMNRWLQGYANKTKIYWWIFAAAGIAAFVIAFVSISFKSIAAASANPVDSLKDE